MFLLSKCWDLNDLKEKIALYVISLSNFNFCDHLTNFLLQKCNSILAKFISSFFYYCIYINIVNGKTSLLFSNNNYKLKYKLFHYILIEIYI